MMRHFVASLFFLALAGNVQSGTVRGQDTRLGDQFGYSVSLSGTSVLVGAFNHDFSPDFAFINDNRGASYLFNNLNSGSNLTSEAVQFIAFDASPQDNFGTSVSLSGSRGLIGAPGKGGAAGVAYFLPNVGSASGQVKLSVSGAGNDRFGVSVSLSDTKALVGAVGENVNQGAVYYYSDLLNTTVHQARLTASSAIGSSSFGNAVSLSGTKGLVGAVGDDTNRGAAYFFADLTNPTTSVKLTITGATTGDQFGNAVSLMGSRALIGAPGTNNNQGAAYYYADLNNPAARVTLTAFDGVNDSKFGSSVSISGTSGLIGAAGNFSVPGAAYLFTDLATPANQVKITAFAGGAGQGFGISVSMDGDLFVVGADFGGGAAGKAYTGSVSSMTTLNAGNTSRTIDGLSFVSQMDWVIGNSTSGNQVTLTQSTGTASTVQISAPSGSSGNSLQIGNSGKVIATTIAVNNGGTLMFTGNTGNDRIGNSTAVTIANGGTLATNGLSEGSSSPSSPPGIGALTLQGGSTIDFGAGQNGSTLLANTGAIGSTGTINILNWSGSANFDNGAAGNDRLLFVTDPMFSDPQLAQFQFYNDSGVAFAAGAIQIQYNGFFELTPVPEPGTWLAGGLAFGAVGVAFVRQRRHSRSPANR